MVPVGKKEHQLILVFGALGLLGITLCHGLHLMGYSVLRQSRGLGGDVSCDPLNQCEILSVINKYKPTVIINLIASSNVDHCQEYPLEAFLGNVKTIKCISSAIAKSNVHPHLIHISTDHLYDGIGPHQENDANPINIYALTKYTGELVALSVGATVLRTNFIGKSYAPNRIGFTDWLFSSIKLGIDFTVFDDVYFSPINMSTMITCMANVIESKHQGIFNLGSWNGVSKAEFARIFADFLGLRTQHMYVGSIKDARLIAPRPEDMRMNSFEFESAFNVKLPYMEDEIKVAANEYIEEAYAIRK